MPLLAFRDHHHLRNGDSAFDPRFETGQNQLSFTPYAEMPTLYLANNAAEIEPSRVWYRNFEYEIERERGFDFTEDLFQPCVMRFNMNEPATVVASTEPQPGADAGKLKKTEMKRRALLVKAKAKDQFHGSLCRPINSL